MRAEHKNTLREIIKTKSRFLSILLICAIGVGFFSGVRATCGDMRRSADDYYDSLNLFDLRILSTFGLTDADFEEIKKIDGVDAAAVSKYTDLATYCDDKQLLTRIYSKTPDEINTLDIYEGRAPEAPDEVIINCYSFGEKLKIGDKLTLEDLTGAEEFPLKHREYTIVGLYNTPMFVSMTQRGSTNIGDGKIDALMTVLPEEFVQEPYTEIYVRSDELHSMQSYSAAYEKLRDKIAKKLEKLGKDRSVIRYEEVLGPAQDKIEKGEAELEKGKTEGTAELEEAKKKLDDAKTQIESGEKELDEGKKKIDEAAPQIEEAQKKIDEGRIQLESSKQQLDSAKQQLDTGESELEKAKQQLDEASKKLTDGEAETAKQRAKLESAKTAVETAKVAIATAKQMSASYLSRYEAAKKSYETAYEQLAKAEEELKAAEENYGADSPLVISYRIMLAAAKTALTTSQSTMESAKAEMEQNQTRLEEAEKTVAENEKAIEEGEPQLESAEKELEEGRKKYRQGLSEYTENSAKIAAGRVQYEAGLAQYNSGKAEFDKGLAEFEPKKAEYDKGVKDYEEGKLKLEEAKAQYEQGLIDYKDGEQKYKEKIASAEKELADAKEKIASAGNAEWYVFTRDDNAGYSEYSSNAERINRIAKIFPVFFLLVAGLVCLTTMSRMVEEQRTQIGTLKALGYSRGAIMRHYMIYAVTAAVIGGTIGAVGGCFLFPGVIIFAYSMMYKIVDIHFLFTPGNLIMSIGSMVAAIAATVYFSCNKALKETPASLMRPKAPKAGKRIFLEKIPVIWNKMNFFAKVSARNLIRYKRRMFMTIVGIAGCTALSLTGFGLKNSITDIADLQYNDIYRYSGYAAIKSDLKLSEIDGIYKTLTDYESETEYTRALIKQYDLELDGKSAQVYITAVEDAELFERFVDLRGRKSKEKISLEDGAVISEKAAKLLGAKAGDEITVKVSDGVNKKVEISAITEQYVSHYLYLSESQYKDIFGELPKYNMIYFDNGISRDEEVQNEFTEQLLENKNVLAVIMNASSLKGIYDTLRIMDLVVAVLIVSAGALAFVVLYNLTNVNITERIREIATLKVLGFYDGEVSSYVFRESIALTLLGALAGLGLGYALCMFVINTAEIDEVMFGRYIHPLSFLWAFLVTAAFSLIVNLIMTKALKRVSMVESLKSVE